MGYHCCRSFLVFLLKFLNYLQTFIGVLIILYSLWMLNHWNQHHGQFPSSFQPSSGVFPSVLNQNGLEVQNGRSDGFDHMGISSGVTGLHEPIRSRKLVGQFSSGLEDGLDFNFNKLPAPWFIYCIMGIGVLLCLVNCVGHIAAEAFNGCCLYFYTMLITVVILFEVALVGDILLNKHWEKDLPYDPTGEFKRVRSFIEDNISICKLVGMVVVGMQALSLLLAMILRAMVSTRTIHYDSDEEYAVLRGGRWQPQLNFQGGQTYASTSFDTGIRSDVWSTRMREKYGLNPSEFANGTVDSRPHLPVKNNN